MGMKPDVLKYCKKVFPWRFLPNQKQEVGSIRYLSKDSSNTVSEQGRVKFTRKMVLWLRHCIPKTTTDFLCYLGKVT